MKAVLKIALITVFNLVFDLIQLSRASVLQLSKDKKCTSQNFTQNLGYCSYPQIERWFDSLNVRLVGNWPFGNPHDIVNDSTRNLVFCSSGGGVYVLDVTNPSNPIKVSEKIHNLGNIWVMHYDYAEQRLYAAGGYPGTLEIWDVSVPENAVKLGQYITNDHMRGIASSGTYVYLGNMAAGLRILDVTDPSIPVEIGFFNTPGTAHAVEIIEQIVYVADGDSGLRIIDVSIPSNPVEINYKTGSFARIAISDSLAFLTGGNALTIFDISDPIDPREIGFMYIPQALDAVANDSIVYVAVYDYGLRIISVSDPANPYEIGGCILVGDTYHLANSGQYVYIANHDVGETHCMKIIDVTDPANPYVADQYQTPDCALSVCVHEQCAFIADFYKGLRIIDISDLTNPYELGCYDTPAGAIKVVVEDPFAYVLDHSHSAMNALRIVNYSDPSNPVEVGHQMFTHQVFSIDKVDSLIFIAGFDAGLRIFSVADPVNPYQVGRCETPGLAYGVEVSGSYAYVADGPEGLRVIDISNPQDPVEVGFCLTADWPVDIVLNGQYAYIAASVGGLYIIDITDPANPYQIAHCCTLGWPEEVQLSPPYLYIAAWHYGLRIFDVSNPHNPQEVGYYMTPMHAAGIDGSEEHVFVATQNTGLQIYENSLYGIESQKYPLSANHVLSATIFTGPLLLPEDKICRVFDITGRAVAPEKMKPGVYIVEIDGVIMQKVVKIR